MKVTYLAFPTSRIGLIIRRDELQDGEVGRMTHEEFRHMLYRRRGDTLYCANIEADELHWNYSAGQCFKEGSRDSSLLELIEL